MKRNRSKYYQNKRNVNLANRPLAVFYQILLVREVEKGIFTFHKTSSLTQLRRILNELLGEVLCIDNADYYKGICQEVLLAESEHYPSEVEVKKCSYYFVKSGIEEYIQGAYQIHISGILDMAYDDVEAAQRYADKLLMILQMRYGKESVPYARMKLHIVGEILYAYKREEFLRVFREDYNYFRRYTMQDDIYYFDALSMFVGSLALGEEQDYDFWMARLKEDLQQRQEDEIYCFHQCKIAWMEAIRLGKEGRMEGEQIEMGFRLMQKTIREFLEKDSDRTRPFYANVYLAAAYYSMWKQEDDTMRYYAQKGLDICEKTNQKETETYYDLYNYLGVWYMRRQNWVKADKLYSSQALEIARILGKENESYIICIGNLAYTAMNLGRDAAPYFKEIKGIKSKELKKKFKTLINNELNYFIIFGAHINDVKRIYDKCLANLEEEDAEEKARLDTNYLAARIAAAIFDEFTEKLLDELGERYATRFSDELASIYWNSRLVWEWKKGNLQNALKISESLMQEMQSPDYTKQIQLVMNSIQLLVLDGQYVKAKKRIFSMLEQFYDRVFEIGYGNLSIYLTYIRILLSIYIHILKKGGSKLQVDGEEGKKLLEEVMRCKTIEREIKGTMGKYHDGEMDLYYFKQAHRKLTALELAYNAGNLEQACYDENRIEYLMELGEYESSASKSIPLRKLIHKYALEELEIRHNMLCAEYFAYFDFREDGPMCMSEREDDDRDIRNYLVFVLKEEKGQNKILEVSDIIFDKMLEENIGCMAYAAKNTENYQEDDLEKAQRHLYQRFAVPVLKYAAGKERLYLGLDFELQALPMDLIFCNGKAEPVNHILLDSICYIGEDTQIDIAKSDALIVGNPKLRLHGEQKQFPLPCGELECIRIAEMFGTKAYIGEEAGQRVLWGKQAKDVIHISTHGECKTQGDIRKDILKGNTLIYSYLTFAGYEDWLEGSRDKNFGNGIVTGDDFLFMDLSKTKLVVLSACMSGQGYLAGLDVMHGLRWAISAAGADSSVTALWQVSDEATAVLMLLFYRNLRSMSAGEALYQAKRRLRSITLAELYADLQLREIIETAGSKGEYAGEQGVSEDHRPFSHWKYWAGFVCYHR